MNRGGSAMSAKGFTIVETMIVLAVTGSIFVMAALLINGRQNKTDFQVGIRNLQQQFQQVINQIASGYYSNRGGFSCSSVGTRALEITAGAASQGTHGDCVFIGSALLTGGSYYTDKLVVVPLAAQRSLVDGRPTPVVGAAPNYWRITALGPTMSGSTGYENISAPNMTESTQLPSSITFKKADYTLSNDVVETYTPGSTARIAILSSGGSPNTAVGSQSFTAYAYTQISSRPFDDDMLQLNLAGYERQLKSVALCFASGGTDQSGLITISAGLEVSYQIKNGVTC
ncbi:MAG: hypothetical protein WAQ24_04550 [Candidatus Saccharimonadales bacterium]